jgi:hypothetical protein
MTNYNNPTLRLTVEAPDMLKPEDIFQLHPKIRWTALASKSNQVIFSQMREGVQSYTSNSEDRAFMEMGPLFITGIAERLTPMTKAGKLICVIACFEKDYVLMIQLEEGHLAISVDKDQALTVFDNILPQIQKMIN